MAWNWGNAAGGGLSGAAAGSRIMPGWGTALGAVGGGLLGGLSGGKGGGPKPPDFQALAQQQNNYNTPWGSLQNGQFSLPGQAQGALQNLQSNMLRASQYDPTQARDQAVNQNLQYGMGVLQPQLKLMDQNFTSGVANTGASPQQQMMENKMLGDRQASLLGNVYTNALNMGNQTQQTQIEQMNQPFNQYNSLIGSSLQRPTAPDLLGAGRLQYGAQRNAEAGRQGGKGGMMSGIGGLGSTFGGKGGGKGGGGGGGGGGVPNLGDYAGQLKLNW